jgi:RNA polymerase sigma-70 factor (ECF subfamily)
MELPTGESTFEELFPSCAGEEPSRAHSDLEKEVTAFFDDLRLPVLRYLSSCGLSPQDGEEVVQEVFLSLFLHLRDDKPRSNIPGWIFRVAHNLGLKRRKKNYRILKLVSPSDHTRVESHLDAAPDPEERLSYLQRRERLLAVVNALPKQDRRCLHLRAENLRYREIAQVLGISLGSVALSLARSIERLSKVDG